MPGRQVNNGWEGRVQEALAERQTAIELSEALFGPEGIFAQVAGTRLEREHLLQHPLYQQAHSRLSDLRAAEIGQFATEIASFESPPASQTIQIPRSLHSALQAEAAYEGVSLLELVRLKLGLPYSLLTNTLVSRSSANR